MSLYLNDLTPRVGGTVCFSPCVPKGCKLTAAHGRTAAGTIHLNAQEGDNAPLYTALNDFFNEMERLCFECAYLVPPTELGYELSSVISALTECDNGCAEIYLCLGNTIPQPKSTAIEEFIKGLGIPTRTPWIPAEEHLGDVISDKEEAQLFRPIPNMAPLPFATHAKRADRPCRSTALEEALKKKADGFAAHLFALIDQKGLDDVTCYKRANIDRKTFSKIRCGTYLTPSKPTALALALALRLNLEETEALLKSAGLALSPAREFDIIIRFCIENEIFDIHEINEVLYRYDQPLLGG